MSFVEVVGWCHVVVLSWAAGVFVLELLGRDSGAGQGQLLPMSSLGSLGMSYRVICRWLLLMLSLEVPGRG